MPLSKEKRREISLRYLRTPDGKAKHAKYNRENVKAMRSRNYVRYMYQNMLRNAKRTGRVVEITEADLVIPEVCPVLGVPLITDGSNGKNRDFSPSIDRIDNNLGYIPGNIVIVSMRANQIKGTASVEELEQVMNFYKSLQGK